jgi:hypothetical protein
MSLLVLVCGFALMSLGQYGGCACVNPMDASVGPTPTATPDHGPMICDFEGDAGVHNFGGSYAIEGGVSPGAGTPPCPTNINGSKLVEPGGAPMGTPANCGRFKGTISRNIAPYPYAQLKFTFPSAADLVRYAPNHAISFWYKNLAPVGATNMFRVEFICSLICNSANYGYDFTPVDNNWTFLRVYFRGYGTPTMARPCGWGACGPPQYSIDWDATHPDLCTGANPHGAPYAADNIIGLQIKAQAAAAACHDFDLLVDDVRFE